MYEHVEKYRGKAGTGGGREKGKKGKKINTLVLTNKPPKFIPSLLKSLHMLLSPNFRPILATPFVIFSLLSS